jgi:hypothetical protein
MYKAFVKIAGEDLEVDAYELQEVLNTALARGLLILIRSKDVKSTES